MPVLPLGLACVAASVQGAGHEMQMLKFNDANRYAPGP